MFDAETVSRVPAGRCQALTGKFRTSCKENVRHARFLYMLSNVYPLIGSRWSLIPGIPPQNGRSGGLTAAGVPATAALSAVPLFRIVTF